MNLLEAHAMLLIWSENVRPDLKPGVELAARLVVSGLVRAEPPEQLGVYSPTLVEAARALCLKLGFSAETVATADGLVAALRAGIDILDGVEKDMAELDGFRAGTGG